MALNRGTNALKVRLDANRKEEKWGRRLSSFHWGFPQALKKKECMLVMERERWVLMKIPRCDIDGVGEMK